MVLRVKKRRIVDEPLDSRFDRWQTEDVYTALETQVGELTHLLDSYRHSPGPEKGPILVACDVKLRTSVEAVQTLRKRCAS
jgi:hypothetical protein